jgi:hypothetical protein
MVTRQGAGEIDQAGFVRDGQQSAGDAAGMVGHLYVLAARMIRKSGDRFSEKIMRQQ